MLRALFLSLLLVTVLTAAAQPSRNPMRSPLDRKVDSLARAAFARGACVGLAIGVIDGDEIYTYAYGETTLGNGELPDDRTVFQIGSITKTFTGILLADQLLRGRVKAGDPISRFVPDSVHLTWFEGKPVTLEMLSNHTSAIPRWEPVMKYPGFTPAQPYAHFKDAQLFHFLGHYTPTAAPGVKYAYSNIAVGLLGELLARQAGTTYADLLHATIARPLKMRDTRLTTSPEPVERLARGYNMQKKPEQPWVLSALSPAGGLYSTLADMLLYARANMEPGKDRLGDAIRLSHQETFADKSARIGLGWHIATAKGRTVIMHGGQTGGYNSHITIEPARKTAVVVLSNLAADNGVGWGLQAYLMQRHAAGN